MHTDESLGRLWRRTAGIGALALFLAGLLVALDLEELVVLAGGLAGLCGLVAALTWLLVRYRAALTGGLAAAARTTGPAAVRGGRASLPVVRGIAAAAARGGRTAAALAAAGSAEVRRLLRLALERGAPLVRRADEQLGRGSRALARATARRVAASVEAIAADIRAQREAAAGRARSRRPPVRARPRPEPARTAARRPPAREGEKPV